MAAPCTAPLKTSKEKTLVTNRQKTIEKSVSLSGTGLFSGEKSTLTICPGKPNSGIQFLRTDIEGAEKIPAKLSHVVGTPRCTILGNSNSSVQTVEHVLAALYALGIDNVLLELKGPEIPIMDGSADPFVTAILECGIVEQKETKKVHTLQTPVSWSQGEVHLVAIPANELKISYTLHFPESSILHSQFYSTAINPNHFSKEIAPSRTFCLYEEIVPFIEKGLIKGGGLDNAVIIKNDVIVNPEGIRFEDEMVRHKVLDLVGDLSLIPIPFYAHIIAIRSGHASNVAFASVLYNHIKLENA